MAKLFLLRHLQSQWNLENRFTGWTDVPLSKKGIEGVKKLASKISKLKIDLIYTSPLARNRETVSRVLMEINKLRYPFSEMPIKAIGASTPFKKPCETDPPSSMRKASCTPRDSSRSAMAFAPFTSLISSSCPKPK